LQRFLPEIEDTTRKRSFCKPVINERRPHKRKNGGFAPEKRECRRGGNGEARVLLGGTKKRKNFYDDLMAAATKHAEVE